MKVLAWECSLGLVNELAGLDYVGWVWLTRYSIGLGLESGLFLGWASLYWV